MYSRTRPVYSLVLPSHEPFAIRTVLPTPMNHTSSARLNRSLAIADGLYMAADALFNVIQEKFKRAPLPRGATLRPGADTPLWLALATTIRPLLRAYGAKALLGHELGIHRGRITEYFVKHSAMPDAERTLRLLEWLGQARARAVKKTVRNTNKSRRTPRAKITDAGH